MAPALTLAEIKRMIGVSKDYLLEHIRRGTLRAESCPRPPGGGRARYVVQPHHLATWMLAGGMGLAAIREVFHPGGDLILVRTGPALQVALGPVVTRAVGSLFQLGREIGRRNWAAVIDLPAVGTEEAVRSLADYSRELARPELVGLHGDELDGWTRRAAEVFDVLIPRAAGPEAQARAIRRLRPQFTTPE